MSNMVGERGRRKGKKVRGGRAMEPFIQCVAQIEKKNLLSTMGQQHQNAMDRFINIRGIGLC